MTPRHAVLGEDAPFPLSLFLALAGLAGAAVCAQHGAGLLAEARPARAAAATSPAASSPTPAASATPAATSAPARATDTATPADCPPLFVVVFDIGADTVALPGPETRALAGWMARHPDALLLVDGHADAALGSPRRNLELSHQRASHVAAALAASGIAPARMTVRGFGAYQPLAGAGERAPENRRVALSVAHGPLCPGGSP